MFGFFGKETSKIKAKGTKDAGNTRARPNKDQLGIFSSFDVDPASIGGNFSDDESLEEELNALSGIRKAKPKPKSKTLVNPQELDRMVAESMKDLDDDVDDDEEDDPDLESELLNLGSGSDLEEADSEIAPVQNEVVKAAAPKENNAALLETLGERITMYQTAETNARTGGDAARVKRLQRGLKTLHDQIAALKRGQRIDESEIPPPVATGAKKLESEPVAPVAPVEVPKPAPVRVAPEPPTPVNVVLHQETSSQATEVSEMVNFLKSRKEEYKHAALTSKQAGNTEAALKYVRVVKQFDPVIAAAEAGQSVDISSIPPIPVLTPEIALIPENVGAEPVAPEVDGIQGKESPKEQAQLLIPTPKTVKEALDQRLEKYKAVEKQANDEGNSSKARRFGRIIKQYQGAIKDYKAGRAVDYAELPCPPGYPPIPGVAQPPPSREPSPAPPAMLVAEQEEPVKRGPSPVIQRPAEKEAGPTEEQAADIFKAPPQPTTVLEALMQRLTKYKSIEKQAQDDGNQRKAKMYARIVKQYEDAVRGHKLGRNVDYSELPAPPGFGPIPGVASPADSPMDISGPAPLDISQPKRQAEAVLPQVQSGAAKRTAPSFQQKQIDILLERQTLFKQAAIDAKSRGEINQAKEFLKISKGFEPLIEASKGGLPVDMKSIPIPPQQQAALESTVDEGFEKISAADCLAPVNLSVDSVPELKDVYRQLEIDFLTQMKTCLRNRDHFRASGDAASANRMEQLAQEAKRDLDRLRVYKLRGDPVPRYRYETKTFSIVRCNTELDDNVMEIYIVRGISYVVPSKEIDTYVKFEFPWPSETPVKHKTTLIKGTNNPEYNQSFMVAVNRQSRGFQRVLKKTIKFEVFSKGSFFSGDKEIGHGGIKIQNLETKCEVHEIFDIFDGRKPVGKLEVKFRLRHPILAKQVEMINEKWITLVD